MMVGFFMILVDATIVAVANPSIMVKLNADYDAVIWVTSAYLLGFAVPLLLAGRLGDRYGPKNLYLLGLLVFTGASLWCGLSGTIGMLIAARVVQGIGAALLTPQTLSTITRIFPAQRRGVAMSVWGATAGVATLVGPLAGGVLVDGLGWQWIFFVNVPVGVIGLGLAFWLVPDLPTEKHGFDLIGVLLSGVGMFMVVFALQEGQSHHWAPWVWGTLAGGVGFMAAFVFWQQANRNEPLVPLAIFRDRDFSLSTLGVATIGFVVTAMILPVMFYAQAVCGLSPTRSAVLTAPMAIATGVLAPWVGKIVDRHHPRPIIGFGFSVLAIALTWLSVEMTPTTPIWRIVLPLTATGIGMAFIWSPLAATATRNLASDVAGAGSGVYNATRQVGSVLGSAGMAAFMTTRISAEMPLAADGASGEGTVTQLPDFLHQPFAAAMSQALLLPAFIALLGVVAAMFLLGFASSPSPPRRRPDPADEYWDDEDYDDDDHYVEFTVLHDEPASVAAPVRNVVPAHPIAPPAVEMDDEGDTEPMVARHDHLLRPPADTWHDEPVEAWHSLLGENQPEQPAEPLPPEPPEPPAPAEPSALPVPPPAEAPRAYRREPVRSLYDFLADVPPPSPSVEPIGFAHNGFHVDDEQRFQPLSRFQAPPAEPPPTPAEPQKPDILSPDYPLDFGSHAHYESPDEAGFDRPSRHGRPVEQPRPNGRHSRAEPDDASSHGRHSRPGD
ncbi:MFS transporter [Mycolicibacterium moriokaense]|nr:MFS transporter [Mycolicibacterium moriokaense]